MKTKNIFKALALAMLMPAMLLTTACSNDDDVANTSNITNKGYALPVTVNVTRGDDGATRATYTDNGNGTGSLGFSAGDKLFVQGAYNEGKSTFAGILDYVSDGTFSGTIMTQTEWTRTTEELLADGGANATLLPAGYEEYGYLSIANEGTYEAILSENPNKAFATSKATAVEQFSWENDIEYSSGFELTPPNAILNFTINGLAASTEVDVVFSRSSWPEDIVVSGKVTTDGDGTATFAIGIIYGNNLKDCTLTVGGNAITLPNKEVEAGKIYNITRAVTPPTLAQTMTTAGMTVKVKYNYEDEVNYCLFSSNGDETYTFQSGYGYAGRDNTMAKDLVVEGGKLVFKQNFYNTIDDQWSNYGFSVTFYSDNSYSQWIPDTEYGSKTHNPSFISVEVNSVPIALTQKITVADLVKEEGQSWLEIIDNNSGKIKADGDYVVRVSDNAKLQYDQSGGIAGDWQNVMSYDNYHSSDTYKFEGD